ncbi:hypothetical protein GH714_014037 [Hevea brasiliensis]|uniref:Uncharacterized protein n=1 Tax=Hevea brasiliensis TaxID=3981 RepID=A0A6A6LHT6_HEVBR|nr:hypothetical protein GH714_014037 [Hevea brasiliensis]
MDYIVIDVKNMEATIRLKMKRIEMDQGQDQKGVKHGWGDQRKELSKFNLLGVLVTKMLTDEGVNADRGVDVDGGIEEDKNEKILMPI